MRSKPVAWSSSWSPSVAPFAKPSVPSTLQVLTDVCWLMALGLDGEAADDELIEILATLLGTRPLRAARA
jgi:hypothetical protein